MAATGYSVDVIRHAVRAGDLDAHYPEVNGRQLAKPVVLADALRAWIERGRTERNTLADAPTAVVSVVRA